MDFSEYYHIYNHSNGNEDLFLSPENYSYFLRKYIEYIQPVCKTYAYCLMPNHFHILVKTRDVEEVRLLLNKNNDVIITGKIISKQFSNFFSCYTQSFNKMYKRRGSLFMKNFKRKEIETEAYFLNLIPYIHNNPVHHRFEKSLEDWEWSSYHSFFSDENTLVERDIVLEWLDGIEGFLRLHQQTIDKKLSQELEF